MATTDHQQYIHRASTTAPVNIAVIKYWGKRDATLNLPTNSSLSVTLSQRSLRAHTTASCSPRYSSDTLTLNGAPSPLTTPRTQACLTSLRRLRTALEASDPSLPKLAHLPLKLASANNFPTAAGLASSAAGFAALVRAIANLYALPQSPEQLSLIARQGSGSACRSLLGGYVAWDAGAAADGGDSVARQVAPVAHWPGMRALVLVVSAERKDMPSTTGMQATVATSSLFPVRASQVVPKRMEQMEHAIAARDFGAFAELAMRDSNSFHACCADTWPPIAYMNDVSRAAVRMCEVVNAASGTYVCAYTFDAGPNCVVFYEEAKAALVEGAFRSVVGHVQGWSEVQGETSTEIEELQVPEKTASLLKDGVSRVIMTEVGEGPIQTEEHLIDEKGEVIT